MSNERDEPVELDFEDEFGETEKARCFLIEGEEHWLPKSQIEDVDAVNRTVTIPRWLAEDRGLV